MAWGLMTGPSRNDCLTNRTYDGVDRVQAYKGMSDECSDYLVSGEALLTKYNNKSI